MTEVKEKLSILILGAAIGFERARRIAAVLKAERNACRCEEAEPDEPEVGYPGVAPCWKRWEDGPEDRTRANITEWCPTCQRRQQFHEAYRRAMKARGAKMRSFQRATAHAIDTAALETETTAMATT